MELRKVDDTNYKLLRVWRNENRQYFVDKRMVDAKTHEKWYKEYKKSVNRIGYIIYVGRIPVGTVSLTIKGLIGNFDVVMIGNKKYAHKHIMTKVMKQIMKTFDFTYYTLEVLKDNKLALGFYKKLGFFELNENEKRKTIIMQRGLPKTS